MRSTFYIILFALLLGCPCSQASASETIRVLIFDNQRSVTVSSGEGMIIDNSLSHPVPKTATFTAAGMAKRFVQVQARGELMKVNGKSYRGTIEVRRKTGGRLQVINDVDIEDYLKGVVAAEVPHDWHREALKAQAVASRTYALYEKRHAGRRAFDIRATVDSQVYLGHKGERSRAVQAVADTEGEVVVYQGEIIAAYYHSSCGGHTEDASVLWGIDEPYLKGVDCDCQQISKYGLWEKRFSLAAFVSALRKSGYRLGAVSAVSAGPITPGGRVKSVVFQGPRGVSTVPSEAIRSALGYMHIPSIFFEPELLEDEVVFSGRGLGHGVGLCQWGAQNMALQGSRYADILRYYYPGTTLARLP